MGGEANAMRYSSILWKALPWLDRERFLRLASEPVPDSELGTADAQQVCACALQSLKSERASPPDWLEREHQNQGLKSHFGLTFFTETEGDYIRCVSSTYRSLVDDLIEPRVHCKDA